jgi:hypothetical protein
MRKRRFTKARIIGMHKEQGGWDSRELQARHSLDRPSGSIAPRWRVVSIPFSGRE